MASSTVWRSQRLMLHAIIASLSLVSAQTASTTLASSTHAASSTSAQGIVSTTISGLSSSSSASATTKTAITHTIAAGEGGFTFSPDVVQADVGDYIEWDFYPTNHSVVRAEYRFPCIPYEDTGVDKLGFFSGFQPVDAILSNPPKYTVQVNDSNPIFYYCSAPDACNKQGMVGVINPNASVSLQTQRQLALNASFELQPGESFPSEDSSSASTTSSSTSTATGASSTSNKHHSSSSTLSSGAIAGIAIGASAVALLAAALVYLCGRNSRRAANTTPDGYDPRASFLPSHHKRVSDMSYMTTGPGSDGGNYPPALPGYISQNDVEMTPPLRSQYSTEPMVARSPSPGQMLNEAPAYAMPLLGPQHQHLTHELEALHEMYVPTEPTENLAPPARHNSIWKGSVERYG